MALTHKFNSRKFRRLREVARDFGYALGISSWRHVWPKFDNSHLEEAVKFFDKHGWVIIQHVFDTDEILAFRESVKLSKDRVYEGDLLANPDFCDHNFILDRRILEVARKILHGTPCYFGDSSVSVDSSARGFHKDNPDKEEQDAPDWQGTYSLIRMGLYLQDHAWHSGGLAVRDRSHTTVGNTKGRPLAVPTELGDVVLWSLRTTHSGYAARLYGLPYIFLPVPILNRLVPLDGNNRSIFSKLFHPCASNKRMALFATFGVEDDHLHRYIEYLKTRQYAVQRWQQTTYSEVICSNALERGVKLISMNERVRHIDVNVLNKGHVYFPWKNATHEPTQGDRG